MDNNKLDIIDITGDMYNMIDMTKGGFLIKHDLDIEKDMKYVKCELVKTDKGIKYTHFTKNGNN